MLELDAVTVTIAGRTLLQEVSATVPAGSWLGLVGPNGAGKSTLIRAIAGLVGHTGRVRIGGVDYGRQGPRRRARAVAYVPQQPVLPRTMTVSDYVLLGRWSHHAYLGAETLHDRRVTARVLDRLELSALAGRPLGQLSGGEAQRTVLARALVQEAPVLLLDEPTTSLDLGHSQLVLELADHLRREQGLCLLSALHDLNLAGQYCERLLVIHHGRAALQGTAADVLTERNVRRFFGAEVRVVPGPGGPVVHPVRPPQDATEPLAFVDRGQVRAI